MTTKDVERLAQHTINLRGLPANLTPDVVLLTEMARAEAAVEFLDELVMGFSGMELIDLPELIEAGGENGFAMAYHVPMEVWKLWMENRKMLASLAANVVKLGLEERRLAQQDEKARQAYQIMQTLLSDPAVGLTSQQRRVVGQLIAEKLRAEIAIEARIAEGQPILRLAPSHIDGDDD